MIKVFLAMTAVAAVVCAPVAWADTFVLGGTGAVGAPTQGDMAFLITDGTVEPDTMVGIDYPAQLWPLFGATTFDDSVLAGTYTLDYAINHAAGPATVVGISLGAVVINYEKRRLISAYDPPFDITFVTLGDPTNADGGLLAKLPPVYIPVLDFTITPPPVDTPYDTVEVVREFDGFADVPDHLFNWIANLNALAGVIYIHPDYGGLDLNDPDNVITSTTNSLGGTTTHILVATDNLPLTQPLRDLGGRQAGRRYRQNFAQNHQCGIRRSSTRQAGAGDPTSARRCCQRPGSRHSRAATAGATAGVNWARFRTTTSNSLGAEEGNGAQAQETPCAVGRARGCRRRQLRDGGVDAGAIAAGLRCQRPHPSASDVPVDGDYRTS
jgi:hypothetical protein